MYSMNMIAATMITKTIVWFIVLSISTITVGLTDFSCETTRPLKGSNVTCTCNSTNNIDWQLNDVSLSICTTTGVCLPQEDGYSFQTDTNSAEKKYSLTVLGYDYSSCTVYSCTDITTTVEEKMTLSIAAFNSTSPSVIVEPGNHQNGRIEITTECLFKESDIAVEWYTVNGKKENKYTPETDASFKTSSACTDTCNGEAAVKLNIGFTHTEEKSKIFKQTVQFRLKVYHKEDRSNILNLTTTGDYYIKASTTSTNTAETSTPSSTSTSATSNSTQESTSTSLTTKSSSTVPSSTSTTVILPITSSDEKSTDAGSTVTDNTSSETTVIIVSAVVGGLFVIGMIIAVALMLLSHKRKKHASRRKQSYKEDGYNWQRYRPKKSYRSTEHHHYGNQSYDESTRSQYERDQYIQSWQPSRSDLYRPHSQNEDYRPNPYFVGNIQPRPFGRYSHEGRRVDNPLYYDYGKNQRQQHFSHLSYPPNSDSIDLVRQAPYAYYQRDVVPDYSSNW